MSLTPNPVPVASYGTRPFLPVGQRLVLRHQAWRERLECGFTQVDDVFDDCADVALATLSPQGFEAWLAQARRLGKLGRGVEPVLAFLEIWPSVAKFAGEASLSAFDRAVQALQKSPNGPAIAPFIQTLGAVAKRLRSPELLAQYFDIAVDFMQRTSVSVHGRFATQPSPGLPFFLQQAPTLVGMVPLDGLRRWVDEGIRLHGTHPQRQIDYFSLSTADSRAVLQRERRGTLLVDAERQLDLTLRALWDDPIALVPYPVGLDQPDRPGAITAPYMQDDGLRLPEVLEDVVANGAHIGALDQYRAMLLHMASHRRYSQTLVADNLSPLQRMAVEVFEDCRVDYLALQHLPGLRSLLLSLHPMPAEDACDTTQESSLRHRLVCLSRALLDPNHPYRDPVLLEYQHRFFESMAQGAGSSRSMASLALSWAARTRRQDDQQAAMRFTDTVVRYRDDNRHLWVYIEAGDEEESFHDPRQKRQDDDQRLPPRLYPEWDGVTKVYRPDWVSVYDTLQASGAAANIDQLLQQHASEARHIKRLLDLLKPQDRTRLRYQEEGTELDLDVAIRSISDWRSGCQPDPRIHMSTRTDGRDIAVLLLIDLSASVNDSVPGGTETVLDISRAAVSLLAWAISQLGDQLAIAGFHSNTRHEVRFFHIKGFSEAWDDLPKARLAGTTGAFSTRMGAALRHGGELLSGRKADRKLMLVLTDGQPADVDVSDPAHLQVDAAAAVRELAAKGLHTHCVSLDAKADEYVGAIFGHHWTVVDRVEQLPRRLPELFMSLTR